MGNFTDYNLTIKVDVNDLDFRTVVHKVKMSEIGRLDRIFSCLERSRNSWIWDVEDFTIEPMRNKYGDLMSDDEFELLAKLIPTCEHGYCRSVESVELSPVNKSVSLVR